MTIIRESRGTALEALHRRASEAHGAEFAQGLCDMIETYRAVAAGAWPEWPTPTNARIETRRIMEAVGELLAAYGEASEAVQARLRTYMRESGLTHGALDPRGELFAGLSAVHQAAGRIHRAQPRTKRGDDTRAGFVHALREHFERAGVPMTATASESAYTGETYTSLAVAAVALAFNLNDAAARKAIRDKLKTTGTDS